MLLLGMYGGNMMETLRFENCFSAKVNIIYLKEPKIIWK